VLHASKDVAEVAWDDGVFEHVTPRRLGSPSERPLRRTTPRARARSR
jgi:hypothetical protein